MRRLLYNVSAPVDTKGAYLANQGILGMAPLLMTLSNPEGHLSDFKLFQSSYIGKCKMYCLYGSFLLRATRFLFLVFLNFFVSVPCARLGWPSAQLLSARKYTVSYRIE